MDAVYQVPSSAGIKVGIATSLACIALPSPSTIFFQMRKGLTHFAIARPMLLPIVIGLELAGAPPRRARWNGCK